MVWMPFICLGLGFVVGVQRLPQGVIKAADWTTNGALIFLMLTIGANIGTNDEVIGNIGTIGINCAVTAALAITCSVIFCRIIESTLLPLEAVREKLLLEKTSVENEVDLSEEEQKKSSPLIWIMPVSILAGIAVGKLLIPDSLIYILGIFLTVSLVILYTSVGISLGINREVFQYVKVLGFRIIFLSAGILAGSLLGGAAAGLLLGVPLHVTTMAASGMSYYSLTGAFMTQAYGIETGTYGFVVNVMREFFTVLLLPLLVRIGKSSPIASGAAGNMDTMLVPVTKFVGPELGLVALITGTILTFAVPFLLPILHGLFF